MGADSLAVNNRGVFVLFAIFAGGIGGRGRRCRRRCWRDRHGVDSGHAVAGRFRWGASRYLPSIPVAAARRRYAGGRQKQPGPDTSSRRWPRYWCLLQSRKDSGQARLIRRSGCRHGVVYGLFQSFGVHNPVMGWRPWGALCLSNRAGRARRHDANRCPMPLWLYRACIVCAPVPITHERRNLFAPENRCRTVHRDSPLAGLGSPCGHEAVSDAGNPSRTRIRASALASK